MSQPAGPFDTSPPPERTLAAVPPLGDTPSPPGGREHLPYGRILLAAAALVAGGLVVKNVTGDNSGPSADRVPTASPFPTSPGETQPAKEDPSGETELRLGLVQPGEPTVEAERPNGDKIRLPKLRKTDNPYMAAGAALDLAACGITTTSPEDCLSALTDIEAVKQIFRNRHTNEVEGVLNSGEPKSEDVQTIMMSSPSDPAILEWKEEGGKRLVVLTGGTLYYGQHTGRTNGFTEWQDPRIRQIGALKYKITNLKIGFGENSDGQPTVTYWEWNIEEAS